jgi:hypothetical protein
VTPNRKVGLVLMVIGVCFIVYLAEVELHHQGAALDHQNKVLIQQVKDAGENGTQWTHAEGTLLSAGETAAAEKGYATEMKVQKEKTLKALAPYESTAQTLQPSSEFMLTPTAPTRTYAFDLADKGEPIITVGYDGTVKIREGVTLDAASRKFWEYVGQNAPCACGGAK